MDVAYGDLTQLAGNLSNSASQFTEVASRLIREAAQAVQEDAKERAPKRTGALANSIVVVFSGPLTAVIGPTMKYGVFQELGTRGPYKIRPKYASRLRFQVDGKTVFAKEVTHPGLQPNPYMRPAAAAQLSALQDGLGQQAISLIVSGDNSDN